MPFTYQIDKEHRLVLSTASGTGTAADIVTHYAALAKDPDFSPEFDQFVDLTQVTRIEISTSDVIEDARRHLFSSGSRRAAVVSTDEAYGLLRMFMAYHEMSGGEEQVHVFRKREEALEWLKRAETQLK